MKLKEIALVQMGHSFRSRLEATEHGRTRVLQMKDISSDNRLVFDNLIQIDIKKIKLNHLLETGDIVFRARGCDNSSALVDRKIENTIIAAPLFRIRIKKAVILPIYLHWYLNQETAQNYLKKHAKGTSVKMISKKTLEEMEIFIPPNQIQSQIIEIAELANIEKKLLITLALKRKQLIDRMLLRRAQNSGHQAG